MKKCTRADFVINPDLSVTVRGNLYVGYWAQIFDELPVEFKSCRDFDTQLDILGNDYSKGILKSMKGVPSVIDGSFNFSGQKIESLKDGPRTVYRNYLANNNKIKDLTYIPNRVDGVMSLKYNQINSFKSIENKFYRIQKDGNPMGRRISPIDPYGEENWEE